MSDVTLQLEDVCQHFKQGSDVVHILNNASLSLQKGEVTALIGPSGAGKTTLLNIAGLLENPASGRVMIKGHDVAQLSVRKKARLRRTYIGFVFQTHRLLPEFSAVENIMVPQMINGLNKFEAQKRAMQLLAMIDLDDRANHRPGQLSGGEQQRVAIARAVANAPTILLADEPTGNLDPQTGQSVFETLQKIIKGTGASALIVTHNHALARQMDHIYALEAGRVTEGTA